MLVYALIVFIQIDGQKGDYLTYNEEKKIQETHRQ